LQLYRDHVTAFSV